MARRLGLLIATALLFPSSACAALDTKLTIWPREPHVGERATIYLYPYWPYERSDGTCCRLVRADLDYPFRLLAFGPGGRVILFAPHRTQNRYVWRSRLRFTAAGAWRVRIANYYPTPCKRLSCPYHGRELRVSVRS